MSKESTVQIEDGQLPNLIAERDRYQQWLEQLESGRDEIPEHIYERIAADYAARLEKAVEQLRTHVGELEGRLAERRKALAAAVEKVAACNDKLLEARVRHRVGEYDDRRWASVEKELTSAIEAAERQRAALEAEVKRLESALADVRQPALTAEDVGDTPFLKALAAAGASSEPPARNGGAELRNGASRGAVRGDEPSRGRTRKPTELRTLRCDTCGSFNLPEAMFCEACGDDLPAPTR